MRTSLQPLRARQLPAFQPGGAAIVQGRFARIGRALRLVGRKFAMLYRHGDRRLSWIAAACLLLAAPHPSADPQTPQEAVLNEARQLAWLNNWTEAAAVLARLDASGLMPKDQATILFSRAARIRGNIECMALPAAAEQIAAMLASGPAQTDSELRLELLAIKGDIEFQYSLSAAQATWEEALKLASSQGAGRWKARAEGELGTIAFLNGHILAALKLVSGALLKAELSGDVAAQIRYRTALGEGLAEFGRTADAIRFFDKALTLAASTPHAYFPFTAYIGKARLLATTGHMDNGLQMLHQGLNEARRQGFKVREARILAVLGELSGAAGNEDEAVAWLMAAADVAKNAGLDRIEAAASSALASRLRDARKTKMAEVYAARGVNAARHAHDKYHLPQMMAVLAEIEADNGNYQRAEATYVQATEIVDALLQDLPDPRHKNTLIGTMGRVFQGRFELALVGLQDIGKAFQILESAKARGLADLLRGHNGGLRNTSSWNRRPAQQVAVLQRELSVEEDATQRTRLLDRLWELEQRSFRLSPPGSNPKELPSATSVSLQQLQSRLATDELMIEYVLGAVRSFALTISRDRTAYFELKGRQELESAVETYLSEVHHKRDGRAQAEALYHLLLQPIEMMDRCKRIVIIADGKLNLVPFGALVDANDRYVIETRVVSYAPSATVYSLLSRAVRSRTVQMAMLGVGGARYASSRFEDIPSQVRGFGLFNSSGPPRWPAIPQSLAEVTDAAAAQTGKTLVLTGENATEAELKRLTLSSFRVLHLALHSTIDAEFPDRSALVLTSRTNDEEDGLLQAREILGLYLNSELVTLSACDAGAGTIEGIAGMNSLVQAFLMAGSRSVVASIWPADDIFTAALMRRFYANLRRGFDKAEALALAKRELLRINGPTTPPFYWAGFRLVGDSHGTVSGE